MKSKSALLWPLILLGAAMLLASCAGTARRDPKQPPAVQAGLRAVMPPVVDARSWPREAPRKPEPQVRMFSEQITQLLKKDLLARGLFASLPDPDDSGVEGLKSRLVVQVRMFRVVRIGYNELVPVQLLFNGLVLPAYTAVALASKGDIDTGAYIIPSTRGGVDLRAEVHFLKKDIKKPVLKLAYKISVERGWVNERQMAGGGVALGRGAGEEAVSKLAAAIASDQRWAHLNDYLLLAKAEQLYTDTKSTPTSRVTAAAQVLPLLRPLSFSVREVKILGDNVLSAGRRATAVNDMRARLLGLPGPAALPAAQRLTAAQAKALFDDPVLPRQTVRAELAAQALDLLLDAVSDLRNKGQTQELQAKIIAKLRGRPRLVSLLLAEADSQVAEKWPPTLAFLSKFDDSQVKAYLAQRQKQSTKSGT